MGRNRKWSEGAEARGDFIKSWWKGLFGIACLAGLTWLAAVIILAVVVLLSLGGCSRKVSAVTESRYVMDADSLTRLVVRLVMERSRRDETEIVTVYDRSVFVLNAEGDTVSSEHELRKDSNREVAVSNEWYHAQKDSVEGSKSRLDSVEEKDVSGDVALSPAEKPPEKGMRAKVERGLRWTGIVTWAAVLIVIGAGGFGLYRKFKKKF